MEVKKIKWSKSVESALAKNQFTPEIIEELKAYCLAGIAEIYALDKLTVIARSERLTNGNFEVVWMASYGAGLNKYKEVFFTAAARSGAEFIRFHFADDERALLRGIRKFNPVAIPDWSGAYRCSLGGNDES